MTDKMREEFEAAVVELHAPADLLRKGDGYKNDQIQAAWWGWQTSRSAVVVISPEVKAMLDQMESDERALSLKAEAFLRETNRASISALQRNFKLAYENACRLMDAMVLRGVVSPIDSEGRRSVLPVSVPRELLS